MLIKLEKQSKVTVYTAGLFMWVEVPPLPNGWVPCKSLLDGDVALRDREAEQKGPLFCTEEMGVILGKSGQSE